jgi:hypothetical protein
MKEVVKFFGLKAGETQVCNGFTFFCERKEVLCQGSAPTLFGTLTTPTGEVVDYTKKGVFANKLNKLAGVACTTTIPTKTDNSQKRGESKVVAVSDNKLSRQHRAVMHALSTINKVLGYQDGANKLVHSAWYEYSNEQQAIAQRLKAKAEAEAKAKAEAEVKKQAEAEAKQQAKIAEAAELLIQQAMKNGLTREAAESSLKALGLI